MKKFNLDEYLKNPQKKVITRNGRNVRIICTNRKNEKYPIVALVAVLPDNIGNCEETYHYTTDGEWVKGETHSSDLLFASEKKEGWINIYKIKSTVNPCISSGLQVHNTKEEAEAARGSNTDYIDTVKIKWEE